MIQIVKVLWTVGAYAALPEDQTLRGERLALGNLESKKRSRSSPPRKARGTDSGALTSRKYSNMLRFKLLCTVDLMKLQLLIYIFHILHASLRLRTCLP